MDGFVTRRPQRTVLGGGRKTTLGHLRTDTSRVEELHTGDKNQHKRVSAASQVTGLKSSISDSLKAIDETAKPSHRQERKKKRQKHRRFKIVSIIVGLVVLVIAGFMLFKLWQMMGQVFGDGNIFNLFSQQKLKEDAHGRSNVLILGTTDDDPDHPGATLTDSMMVLSINQTKKDAYMFSIPRDLYVKFNRACNSGYAGKINEYFGCIDDGDSKEAEMKRMDGIREFVGDIFGMDIQYVAHINTMVIRDAVNAVGGVTVKVQSRDPRGVLDGSIDWMCQARELSAAQRQERCPTGHYIHFTNGEHYMDGDKAMWFSRARGLAAPTYGLEQSNFDREKNQQLVLMALKDKATSSGTLTDIGKVTSLMGAMGANLRTNIDSKEIRTVMSLASDMKMEDIHQLSFVEEDNLLMTTGNIGGMSIVQPAAGLYDYSEIRSFIKREIYATPVSSEKATVAVLNGSGITGAAQKQADRLSELGMKVVYVGNAPGQTTVEKTVIYQASKEEKKATKAKLEELYSSSVTAGSPPYSVEADAQFIVVVGSDV